MKIELKSIKHSALASKDTLCYEAAIWIDGKKIGVASNDGHGGCDRFYGNQAAYDAADQWCKDNIPDHDGLKMDMELFCALEVEKWLTLKDIKKATNGKICFYDPKQKNLYTIKVPKGQEEAAAKSHKQKNPSCEYLNGLSLEDAYRLYKKPEDYIATKKAG